MCVIFALGHRRENGKIRVLETKGNAPKDKTGNVRDLRGSSEHNTRGFSAQGLMTAS
jgi:hypothetical protein